MNRIVFVNGIYTKEQEAVISIFDRGFIFGDGIYEVVPVVLGKLIDRDYFLERLERSLFELSIPWPCSEQDYIEMMETLIDKNTLQEGIVYSQVTRGPADRDFPFPETVKPGIVAFTSRMEILNNPDFETGIAVTTTPDIRWKRRDIKSINLLGQVLAKQDAVSQNSKEAWMVENGQITEGASSSAYIVKDNVLITRRLSNAILPGIRRRTILEIAERANIAIEERAFSVAEAKTADEALISSATTMVLGVTSIDGSLIGDGTPGPVTRKLKSLYQDRILQEARS
tara:strand:- start:1748 stop:2602 length:855 start_codon:yes stop_codon:yes gene_type:complete